MATPIQNVNTRNEIMSALGLGIHENPPQFATPVVDVNPKKFRNINFATALSSTTTGTMTVKTFDSDSKVLSYITGINWGYVKNVTCDIASGNIVVQVKVGGNTLNLLVAPVLTLTADSFNQVVQFPNPILVDQGSTLSVTGTFTAGSCVRACVVQGYTVPIFEK